MAVVRDFWAKVAYTDADGEHEAGSLVRVPYETDAQIASIHSMLSYGVLTETPPLNANDEQFVTFAPAPSVLPPLLAPNDEGATVWQAPDPAPVVAAPPVEEPVAEVPVEEPAPAEEPVAEVAKDDPETPYFDARDESGQFVAEGTPVEEPAEEPVEEPVKTTTRPPAKKAARKKR